ncbi:MAG: helix-turn-helix domain-containing protein [Bacteroidales bacterium]|nr:helix-turn-helix domain-containing protein [Bacteroidales bacterium]
MTTEEKILSLLKENKEAMSAGQIADATGIDRKEVDKTMKTLKAAGSIVSPKRCYWTAG